jgi:hypothetical protein
MAVVAKMRCTTVTRRGYGLRVACEPEDEGAQVLKQEDLPFWLKGTAATRIDITKTSQVTWEMSPVYSTDPEHENRQFAQASPSGQFTLTVENPAAMNYVREGCEYRVTIERVRSPRDDE